MVLHIPESNFTYITLPDTVVGILSYCELLAALPGGSQHTRVIRIVRKSISPFLRAYGGLIEARLDPDQELDTLAGTMAEPLILTLKKLS